MAKLREKLSSAMRMIACATDYDCWHESEESVTVEMVIGNLTANISNAQRILQQVGAAYPAFSGRSRLWMCHFPGNIHHDRSSLIPADVRQNTTC